jgi:hypothetical protein
MFDKVKIKKVENVLESISQAFKESFDRSFKHYFSHTNEMMWEIET